MRHPLIDDHSPHYVLDKGKQTIEEFEEKYTVRELLSWAKITSDKYKHRLGKKGGDKGTEMDKKKMENYKRYHLFILHKVVLNNPDLIDEIAKDAYNALNIKLEYN